MQVQLNTDKNIEGSEDLAAHVRNVVEKTLGHYSDRVTRVEVHLGDTNGKKTGPQDHSCTMEARPRGLDPVAATHKAGNNHQAIDGAVRALESMLRSRLGKLDNKKGKADLPVTEDQE
jgi:ribosome-associated translation inhibitor RaiA